MFNHQNEKIAICIHATTYIDFKKIDARIMQIENWSQMFPMATVITIPIKHKSEIMNELSQQKGITMIDNHLTHYGIEIQNNMLINRKY